MIWRDVFLVLLSGASGALLLALAVIIAAQVGQRREGFEVKRDRHG